MTLNQLTSALSLDTVINPSSEALIILEKVSQTPRIKILSGDFKLSTAQSEQLAQMIQLRQHLPLAYIINNQSFYDLDFFVDQRVLIPRMESEEIINLALRLKPKFKTVYDFGCGSGCLGISYWQNMPSTSGTQLIFIDADKQALAVSQLNCRRYNICSAKFDCQDLTKLKPSYFCQDSLILANLPYLDINDKAKYEQTCPTLKAEPNQALYTGNEGLELYTRLFTLCRNRNIHLICESLESQQYQLHKLAKQYNFKMVNQAGLVTVFRTGDG